MNYELTQHASEVLAEREIDLAWLERALDNPDLIGQDAEDEELEHRLKKITEYGNRVLKVVINRTTNPNRVITVYFDRTKKDRI